MFSNLKNSVRRVIGDRKGVVSLEYVIVGAVVCLVVFTVFNGTGAASLTGALTSGFTAISATVTGA
jgi:Flp pilus assembly pilin Flp